MQLPYLKKLLLAALQGPQDSVKTMVKEFKRRRDLVVERLQGMGINCNLPQGAFYVLPQIENPELFVEEALKKDVVLVPGTSFGKYGKGHFRISYAASYEDLTEAMDRLESINI